MASTNISFMDLVLVRLQISMVMVWSKSSRAWCGFHEYFLHGSSISQAANINGNGVVKEQQSMVWLPRIFPSWI